MQSTRDTGLLVFFESDFRPLGEAKLGLLTHGLQYGTGVFEGIRGYWSDLHQELYLFRAAEHFARWKRNARLLRMEIPLTVNELCDLTAELVRRNRFRGDIYIRPLAYKSQQGVGVHFSSDWDFALTAMRFGVYIDSSRGLHVSVSPWRRVSDNAIPARGKICGAYVNSALAADQARTAGYDDAIFLTEQGYVSEASAANIFLVRNGRLITPSPGHDILEGITRATVMELAQEMGVAVEERAVGRSELYSADEVFLTGTAYEIAPVTRVDERSISDGEIGVLTRAIQKQFQEVTREAARYEWLRPVYRHHSPAAPVWEFESVSSQEETEPLATLAGASAEKG